MPNFGVWEWVVVGVVVVALVGGWVLVVGMVGAFLTAVRGGKTHSGSKGGSCDEEK